MVPLKPSKRLFIVGLAMISNRSDCLQVGGNIWSKVKSWLTSSDFGFKKYVEGDGSFGVFEAGLAIHRLF